MRWICLCVAIGVMLVSCGSVETKTDYPQPPMYPSASDIIVTKRNSSQRIVEFHTSDGADKVHSFFRDQLLQNGWNVRNFKTDHSSYVYHGPVYLYGLEVDTTTSSGNTFVSVLFSLAGPGLAFPDKYIFPPAYK